MELNYTFIDDPQQVSAILPRLHAMNMYGVDCETTGLNPFDSEILLLQIGNLSEQFVIDARKVPLQVFRNILESNKPKCLHNAKFDYKFIKHHTGIALKNVVDTMLLESVLENGTKKEGGLSLQATYKRYFGIEQDKEARLAFIDHPGGDFTQEQIKYAAMDIVLTIELATKQAPRLQQDGLTHVGQLECLCCLAVADMELAGFKLDADAWRVLTRKAEAEAAELHKELNQHFQPYLTRDTANQIMPVEHTMNMNSETQVLEALNFLGVPIESTGAPVLNPLKDKWPILDTLIRYREKMKLVTSYGTGYLKHIHPKTGRVHSEFRQNGTITGRLSNQAPNLQQVPSNSDFRKCFIPEQGNKLITADYSGAELRIMAEFSQDPVFIDTFAEGEDLHSKAASLIFNKPVSKTENSELRDISKNVVFALAYGAGPHRVAGQLSISVGEAQDVVNKYYEAFPKVKQWLEDASRSALEEGYADTFSGRRRYFDVEGSQGDRSKISTIERQGRNFKIQATNADWTKRSLYRIRQEILSRKLKAQIVSTVHDEIVVECAEGIAPEMKEIVVDCMVESGQAYLKTVPVEVDAKIADYWSK